MLQPADPGHHALDAHTEARVRNRAVPAQIQIPLEGFERQVVLLDPLLQKLIGSMRCEPPMISP